MKKKRAIIAKRPGVFSIIFLFIFLGCVSMFSCVMTSNAMLDVDYINQLKNYPTGCESVSTVMALNYAGIDITVDEFIDEYLPKEDAPHKNSKGKMVGGDPYKGFLGNPYKDSGYGCFAPVIKTAVDNLLDDKELSTEYEVKELYDHSVQGLCFRYVRQGTPVIFWATAGMKEASEGATWTISETGEKYTWIKPMHCLLLVGYDSKNYYFNDPQTDKQYAYDKNDVEKAYEVMGSQAVVILKK